MAKNAAKSQRQLAVEKAARAAFLQAHAKNPSPGAFPFEYARRWWAARVEAACTQPHLIWYVSVYTDEGRHCTSFYIDERWPSTPL